MKAIFALIIVCLLIVGLGYGCVAINKAVGVGGWGPTSVHECTVNPTRDQLGIVPVHAIKGTPGSGRYFVCRDDCASCEFFCWHNRERNIVSSMIR